MKKKNDGREHDRKLFLENSIFRQQDLDSGQGPTLLLPLDFDSSHHLLDLGVSVCKVSREMLHVDVLCKYRGDGEGLEWSDWETGTERCPAVQVGIRPWVCSC